MGGYEGLRVVLQYRAKQASSSSWHSAKAPGFSVQISGIEFFIPDTRNLKPSRFNGNGRDSLRLTYMGSNSRLPPRRRPAHLLRAAKRRPIVHLFSSWRKQASFPGCMVHDGQLPVPLIRFSRSSRFPRVRIPWPALFKAIRIPRLRLSTGVPYVAPHRVQPGGLPNDKKMCYYATMGRIQYFVWGNKQYLMVGKSSSIFVFFSIGAEWMEEFP